MAERDTSTEDAAVPAAEDSAPAPPAAAQAAALAPRVRAARKSGLIVLASSERRAEEVACGLRAFLPEARVVLVPPWDSLPYDRASPSRESMGRRMAAVIALSEPAAGPRVVVGAPAALLQRLPPAEALADAVREYAVGDLLDAEELAAWAARTGWLTDERVDEPGEIALRAEVAEVYPPDAAAPCRMVLDADGRITALHAFDPATQRTTGELERVRLIPASEWIVAPAEAAPELEPGAEHRLPEAYAALRTVFDLLPDAWIQAGPRVRERVRAGYAQLNEAHDARLAFATPEEGRTLPPEALYVSPDEWAALLAARGQGGEGRSEAASAEAAPNFAAAASPGRAFSDWVRERRDEGRRVVLTGAAKGLRSLARALKRGLDAEPETLDGPDPWAAALKADAGALLAWEAALPSGFVDPAADVAVVDVSDVLGAVLDEGARRGAAGALDLLSEPELAFGDVVIHEDHGVGVLRDLTAVEEGQAAGEHARLEYAGGADLLAPVSELGRVWRYGGEEDAVSLDRLKGDAWAKRRAEASVEVDEAARGLVELARARDAVRAPVLEPPRAAYARFASRFPYPETPDQASAIAAVLEDLASGKPMNRLVCGDVGYGKTEVALRAAAAAALSGKQVAVVAPTTVLARQHLRSFERRFEGTGITVGHLSRLVPPAEAKAVREGLASGAVRVVVGTHAVAGKEVRFKDLGLVVIDEEQKFGTKLKASLHDLAPEAHLLTLTATPIPRTLAAAMVGVQALSVIATPPARRRPVRTLVSPWDGPTVRGALMRERRRGGQSFMVCPRIEDIAPLAERLAELAPELRVVVAHGDLPAQEVDEVMVGFAEGAGDVLLATNIIESGLDVPRANTMLIYRPDRFGLSQLHQLRGRVGRGRAQGVCYLLPAEGEELSEAAQARLSTLEALDRLGAGLAVSARDLDIRGAGDLVGEAQAGHVKLIGVGLYQRLLAAAVRLAKGEAAEPDWTPELNLGPAGSLPQDYVPEAQVRLNLYARLARLETAEAARDFAEELEDRFGPPPEAARALLERVTLQLRCRACGVQRLDAGPKAVAATLRTERAAQAEAAAAGADDLLWKDGRLVLARASEEGPGRAEAAEALLDRLETA